MPNETLSLEELEALKAESHSLSEDILAERIQEKDGRYVFRAIRKTDRAFAGILDVEGECAAPVPQFEFAEITLISPGGLRLHAKAYASRQEGCKVHRDYRSEI